MGRWGCRKCSIRPLAQEGRKYAHICCVFSASELFWCYSMCSYTWQRVQKQNIWPRGTFFFLASGVHIFCPYADHLFYTRQYNAYGHLGAEAFCIQQAFSRSKERTYELVAASQWAQTAADWSPAPHPLSLLAINMQHRSSLRRNKSALNMKLAQNVIFLKFIQWLFLDLASSICTNKYIWTCHSKSYYTGIPRFRLYIGS